MASNGAYKVIYPSNGYLVKQTVRVFDASTNTFALAGALALTVTFSSTADGATPITGLTGLALTELVSFPGVYTRAVAGTLTVALAPWAEQVVYQIVQNVSGNGLRVVTPVLVAGTLTVALAPWADQVVYQIVQNPSTNGLRVVTPVLVAPNRLAL